MLPALATTSTILASLLDGVAIPVFSPTVAAQRRQQTRIVPLRAAVLPSIMGIALSQPKPLSTTREVGWGGLSVFIFHLEFLVSKTEQPTERGFSLGNSGKS